MDRINFSNSINNLCELDIIEIFDSIMTLYNIIENYENIDISKTPSDVASFNVTFSQDANIHNVLQMNGCTISIYDSIISIQCNELDNNTINFIFNKIGMT